MACNVGVTKPAKALQRPMKIRKRKHANGTFSYQVDLGIVDGKRVQISRKTKVEAGRVPEKRKDEIKKWSSLDKMDMPSAAAWRLVTNKETPRLCRGDSRSLTYKAVFPQEKTKIRADRSSRSDVRENGGEAPLVEPASKGGREMVLGRRQRNGTVARKT